MDTIKNDFLRRFMKHSDKSLSKSDLIANPEGSATVVSFESSQEREGLSSLLDLIDSMEDQGQHFMIF